MLTKICPKCNETHEKTGTFCSRSCANGRKHSPETRLKISRGTSKATRGKGFSEAQLTALKKAGEHARAVQAKRLKETPFEKLSWYSVRKRIIEEQGGACFVCKLTEWNTLPITLEVDHEDGNKHNNERANLRALCPNCHAQTPTWRRAKSHPRWSRQ